MLDAAKNKVRVKVSYIMIALTVAGCILMIIEGKKISKKIRHWEQAWDITLADKIANPNFGVMKKDYTHFAAQRHETLTSINLAKKARLREEAAMNAKTE
ncbi:hypothetical protein P7K49_031036 [Saguinus oedipus]|uniref:Protein FAM162A n=1 Tax=Saguinus oedipus TaxID=9490 RepID=A0ABQ9U3V6_SAGOE|nr:hypothetical protein P7K49_031036 [Saguinus oedipus]